MFVLLFFFVGANKLFGQKIFFVKNFFFGKKNIVSPTIPPWWNWGPDLTRWESDLQQQLWRRSPTCTQLKGSVYVINCSACTYVYIWQTGKQIASRMTEHVNGNQAILGAERRHKSNQGHHMDIPNPTQVFLSDCVNTRPSRKYHFFFRKQLKLCEKLRMDIRIMII